MLRDQSSISLRVGHWHVKTHFYLISMQDTVMSVAVCEMFICSKIGAKSFGDGSQDICKYKESNLGPVAGF